MSRHSGRVSGREERSDGDSRDRARERSDAERRHPRPSAGSRSGSGSGSYYGSHGGYRGRVRYGHYGNHYHGSIFFPYSCYHYGYDDYYYDGPYRYRRYYVDDPTGAVRVLVDPSKTKVFVDGYYAGVADDFDGLFQRLYLPPGRHEIALKLAGHKTHRVQIYSARGHTIKLHHDMVRGEGQTETDDFSVPVEDGELVDTVKERGDDEGEDRKGDVGALRLTVTPKDASVYVDGEFWGSGVDEELKLPVGRHEIAVVRPGFATFEREVNIRSGATTELEIDLRKS